ncbi:MAG TPA: hypothetical protein VHY20_16225, partial [Pirellulales bacterium]|nr:hypothetical protein [Pirellulales bacterium]
MKRSKSSPPAPVVAPPRWRWSWSWGPPLLLAIVILLTFADSFDDGLVLDNHTKIGDDSRIQAVTPANLYLIFTQNYWWPTYESDLYRPLTSLTYLVNYSVLESGDNPLGYHLVNTLLHWLNAWLVFLLAARFLQHRLLALLLTVAFAVHPLTIEAVTNIVGRADLLAGLFMLAGLELHSRLRTGSSAEPLLSRLALGLCAVLAVFSKESGVVLIALMLLDDLSNLPAIAGSTGEKIRAWLRFIPWKNYAAVLPAIIALFVARYELLKNSPISFQMATDNPTALSGFWTREMTAVKVLGYYLELTFWPARLSCDYSYNQIPAFGWSWSGADLDAWLGLAMVALLSVAALASWRRLPAVFFFLGFAFITLLPVSNLVITIGTIMGERFMYLPLVGILGALAAWGEWLAARPALARLASSPLARRLGGGLAVVIIVALATRTVVRNRDWYDNTRLWESAMRVSPDSFKVYKGLATSLSGDPTKLDERIALALEGLAICDAGPLPLEHSPNGLLCDLAHYYAQKGDQFRQAGKTSAATTWYKKADEIVERAIKADRAVNAAARRDSLARGMKAENYHDV